MNSGVGINNMWFFSLNIGEKGSLWPVSLNNLQLSCGNDKVIGRGRSDCDAE